MTLITYKSLCGTGAVAAALALGAVGFARADNLAEESRYPYDPVCSWGRVANGKGMLVRCMTAQEALRLTSAAAATSPAASPPAPAASSASTNAPSAEAAGELEVRVGPLVADTGSLGGGDKRLGEAADRYKDCVIKYGGLADTTAEITLRFLVRERGRAEGVSVTRRKGLTKEAARCLANVVDRRFVGTPAEPMVGATLTLKFTQRSK